LKHLSNLCGKNQRRFCK